MMLTVNKSVVAASTNSVPVCTKGTCSKGSWDWQKQYFQGDESNNYILLILWYKITCCKSFTLMLLVISVIAMSRNNE